MTYILLTLLVCATVLLGRVMSALVVYLTDYLALLGGSIHKGLKMGVSSQADSWLFSLLFGVTKIPLIIVFCAWFFLMVTLRIVTSDWVTLGAQVAQGLLIFFMLLRFSASVIAGIIFGPEVHDVLKSLQS